MNEEFSGISTEDLLVMRANAYETYCLCGGHGKAARNKWAVRKYTDELVSRGISEETMKSVNGKFNGRGSM